MNQDPFIEDDTLIVAPLDSRSMLALDPQTGRMSYRIEAYVRRRSPIRHQVIPRGDGRILMLTDMGIECYEARTGAVVWPHKPFDSDDAIEYSVDVTGAATRSGDTLLVPCARQLVLVDHHQGVEYTPLRRGQRILGGQLLMNAGLTDRVRGNSYSLTCPSPVMSQSLPWYMIAAFVSSASY